DGLVRRVALADDQLDALGAVLRPFRLDARHRGLGLGGLDLRSLASRIVMAALPVDSGSGGQHDRRRAADQHQPRAHDGSPSPYPPSSRLVSTCRRSLGSNETCTHVPSSISWSKASPDSAMMRQTVSGSPNP